MGGWVGGLGGGWWVGGWVGGWVWTGSGVAQVAGSAWRERPIGWAGWADAAARRRVPVKTREGKQINLSVQALGSGCRRGRLTSSAGAGAGASAGMCAAVGREGTRAHRRQRGRQENPAASSNAVPPAQCPPTKPARRGAKLGRPDPAILADGPRPASAAATREPSE